MSEIRLLNKLCLQILLRLKTRLFARTFCHPKSVHHRFSSIDENFHAKNSAARSRSCKLADSRVFFTKETLLRCRRIQQSSAVTYHLKSGWSRQSSKTFANELLWIALNFRVIGIQCYRSTTITISLEWFYFKNYLNDLNDYKLKICNKHTLYFSVIFRIYLFPMCWTVTSTGSSKRFESLELIHPHGWHMNSSSLDLMGTIRIKIEIIAMFALFHLIRVVESLIIFKMKRNAMWISEHCMGGCFTPQLLKGYGKAIND